MPDDAASESQLACWAALSQDGVNVLLAGTGDALMWGNLYAGLYLEALGEHGIPERRFFLRGDP